MKKQEEILIEIEECILPIPATKTYVTRNIAREIAKDIVFKLDELGAVIKVDGKLPAVEEDYPFERLDEQAKMLGAGYTATEPLVKDD